MALQNNPFWDGIYKSCWSLIFFSLHVWVFCLHLHVYLLHAQCLRVDSIRFPGTLVRRKGCEPPGSLGSAFGALNSPTRVGLCTRSDSPPVCWCCHRGCWPQRQLLRFSGTLPPGALTAFPGWLWFPSLHRSFLGLVLLIEVSTPHSRVEASVAF